MSLPVATAAAVEPEAGVWEYISPSRLNLWLRCPLAFKFRYIDGIRSPTTASMFLGKVVHAGLESFYRHKQLGTELERQDVLRHVDEYWSTALAEEEVQFESLSEEVETRQQAAGLIGMYLDRLRPDEGRPTAVETRLKVPLVDPSTAEDLGVPLLGVIDLVLDEASGPVICDFKTAAKSNNPVEILHEVQLTSYAYLFRETTRQTEFGLEIRSLIKTKTPKLECHQYSTRTDTHFRRFFQLVRAYLDDLDAGRFVYRPGWACTMCEHRDRSCAASCF